MSPRGSAGPEEKGVRAVPLDPQIQAMRDQRERDSVPPLYTMSLTEARAADLASIRAGGGEPEPVHEVTDLTIAGPGGELPLRLYRPASERTLPALLYFFGGGWVLGTIDTADGGMSVRSSMSTRWYSPPWRRLASLTDSR